MNLIEQFYTSFQKLDAQGMIACYHDEISFHDPAFGELDAKRTKAMWQMLCEQAKDFHLEYSDAHFNGTKGSAHWEAKYIFSQTGKSVHNKIDAEFHFQDGLIVHHIDRFNLHSWARQALGFQGFVLGGTGFFRKKLQQQTNHLLDRYIQKNDL